MTYFDIQRNEIIQQERNSADTTYDHGAFTVGLRGGGKTDAHPVG